MEGPRSTLQRDFLLGAIPFLAILGHFARRPALLALAGALALLALGSYLAARRAARGLRLRRRLASGAFEWDTVPVAIEVESREREVTLVEITDRFGPAMADAETLLLPGPVPPGGARLVSYAGFCARRWGIHSVGPLRLSLADPLGLFHQGRAFPSIEEFPVYPRVHEVAGLDRRGARSSLHDQDQTGPRPGQSLQYLGARDYRPGDDLRRLHWPATARRGFPIVKELEVDLVPHFSLFLDLHRENRAGTGQRSTREIAVRVAASILWSAIGRGDTVQLFAEGGRPIFVPPGRGGQHLSLLLEELIRAQEEGTAPLLEVFALHCGHVPPGSTACFLFGTAILERESVSGLLDDCETRGVRPILVLVDSFTLAPWEKWRLPPREARERIDDLRLTLRARRIPFAILDGDTDLEAALARPDLFSGEPA